MEVIVAEASLIKQSNGSTVVRQTAATTAARPPTSFTQYSQYYDENGEVNLT